mmetsp:Transcript_22453/g.35658  ORF Transcript_22453/g.35658 Transcript_22453/m.35658 type:complete len:211 (-) Transcript_22453:621-1253(-)
MFTSGAVQGVSSRPSVLLAFLTADAYTGANRALAANVGFVEELRAVSLSSLKTSSFEGHDPVRWICLASTGTVSSSSPATARTSDCMARWDSGRILPACGGRRLSWPYMLKIPTAKRKSSACLEVCSKRKNRLPSRSSITTSRSLVSLSNAAKAGVCKNSLLSLPGFPMASCTFNGDVKSALQCKCPSTCTRSLCRVLSMQYLACLTASV